jgi:hypothetical protein
MPAGGAVHVFVQPSSGATDKILITGAVGDYGTALSENKNGKPNANNGDFAYVKLTQGSFEVNKTKLQAAGNNATPSYDKSTCSFSFSASAPVTFADGTGLYKGISGTVMITESYGGIGSRYTSGAKKGLCNTSNNAPLAAQLGTVEGTGTVKF